MYSGSDSTESPNYSQWALNPSTYQNMSNEQVDWAALAQQWIIMKEAGPPPVLSDTKSKTKKEQLNEEGEAPMDVENDKDESLNEWNNLPSQQSNNWTWNTQNQTWGWNNAWTPPTGVPPPIPMKPPLLPTPANYNQFNVPPDSNNDNANFPGYNTASNTDFNSGYWTAGNSKQIKPHNRRFSKVNVPRPVQPIISETQPTLDATKRKQLPAWIREGLEKMERDKQKQLEREKEKQEREEYNEKLRQNEKETMEILKSTIKEQERSKFDSDGENSEDEITEVKKPIHVEPPPALTQAEQMMNVRRTMTEILLKVTNREIEQICREELQRHRKKSKASDRRVSAPSGANISGELGLGIYGGGSGSSSGEDSEEDKDDKDSDTELKDSIKRKKAEFSKTEREIEDKLAEAENRKQDPVSRTPSPETNDNETQVDAKLQGIRKRRSISHSKTTKRTKSRSSSSSSDSYRESRKRSSTRRSSTSSRDSKKTYKRRSRSTTRSHTPDKSRHKSTKSKRSRSRSNSKYTKYGRRSRSRSRSSSYKRRRSRSRRSRSPYVKRRRSRSKSRRRRSRSSSSGRGKRSRRH